MESVTRINKLLETHYGVHDDMRPNWRVVMANEQTEKRFGEYEDSTPSGVFIRRVSEVREALKYPWVGRKWILERLVPVPITSMGDLPDIKLSYELLWVFEDANQNPLPPKFDVAKLVIDTTLGNTINPGGVKYKDPNAICEDELVNQKLEADKVHEELFGNETDVGDALAYGYGVGYGRRN